MSKEYIEREAALAIVYDNWGALSCSRISYDLEELPAADVAPVVHGEWMPFQRHMFTSPDEDMWYCSKCNYETNWRSFHCPICGAKMRD